MKLTGPEMNAIHEMLKATAIDPLVVVRIMYLLDANQGMSVERVYDITHPDKLGDMEAELSRKEKAAPPTSSGGDTERYGSMDFTFRDYCGF